MSVRRVRVLLRSLWSVLPVALCVLTATYACTPPEAPRLLPGGAIGLRLRSVDEAGQAMPEILVMRDPEGRTQVTAGGKIRILVPDPVWDEVLARMVEVEMAPRPAPSILELSKPTCIEPGCLEVEAIRSYVSSQLTFEAGIGEADASDAALRSALEALQLRLVDVFPHCRLLQSERFESDLHRLRACVQLDGSDLFLAAEVYNVADGPLRPRADELVAEEFGPPFAPDVIFAWPGEDLVRGREAVAALWEEKTTTYLTDHVIRVDEVEASGDVVRVTGRLEGLRDGRRLIAEQRQQWRRNADGRWEIATWSIGGLIDAGEVGASGD